MAQRTTGQPPGPNGGGEEDMRGGRGMYGPFREFNNSLEVWVVGLRDGHVQ